MPHSKSLPFLPCSDAQHELQHAAAFITSRWLNSLNCNLSVHLLNKTLILKLLHFRERLILTLDRALHLHPGENHEIRPPLCTSKVQVWKGKQTHMTCRKVEKSLRPVHEHIRQVETRNSPAAGLGLESKCYRSYFKHWVSFGLKGSKETETKILQTVSACQNKFNVLWHFLLQ